MSPPSWRLVHSAVVSNLDPISALLTLARAENQETPAAQPFQRLADWSLIHFTHALPTKPYRLGIKPAATIKFVFLYQVEATFAVIAMIVVALDLVLSAVTYFHLFVGERRTPASVVPWERLLNAQAGVPLDRVRADAPAPTI